MSARTKLAAAGLLLLAVRLAVGGESGALPDRLLRGFTPEQIVETAVRLELGTLRAAGDSAVETAEAATPAPVAEPASTPEPEGTPTPAPAPVGVSAEGVPIVPTTIQGGLTMKNETEFSMDLRALLQEGPSIRLAAGQPQVLIVHTHGSEAYTPEGSDRYDASDSCRTEDTNYNIVRVGDTLTAALEQAGLNVLHDRTIYDYPSYTGSYARSGAAVLAYLEQYPSIRVVIDLHRDALCSDDVVYKTMAEIPDAACSQVMLVVGTNGTGLEHPNWQENLKLAVYLQNAVNDAHPTLMRPIALVNERYNQHLTTGSLIVEVGSSGNTLQEALNAAQLFGEAAGRALAQLVAAE